MKKCLHVFTGMVLALLMTATAFAADAKSEPKSKILFTNVHVFDGKNEKRIMNANVLVEGNLIKQVSTKKIAADGATVIDGGGRTMIPGLTDVHWHMTMAEVPQATILTGDVYEIAARAVPTAHAGGRSSAQSDRGAL